MNFKDETVTIPFVFQDFEDKAKLKLANLAVNVPQLRAARRDFYIKNSPIIEEQIKLSIYRNDEQLKCYPYCFREEGKPYYPFLMHIYTFLQDSGTTRDIFDGCCSVYTRQQNYVKHITTLPNAYVENVIAPLLNSICDRYSTDFMDIDKFIKGNALLLPNYLKRNLFEPSVGSIIGTDYFGILYGELHAPIMTSFLINMLASYEPQTEAEKNFKVAAVQSMHFDMSEIQDASELQQQLRERIAERCTALQIDAKDSDNVRRSIMEYNYQTSIASKTFERKIITNTCANVDIEYLVALQHASKNTQKSLEPKLEYCTNSFREAISTQERQ